MMHAGATDPSPDADAPRSANSRRAVEGATLVIIAATAIAVISSSWPMFLTFIDDEKPGTARPGIARALRSRGWAVGGRRNSRSPSMFRPRRRSPLPPNLRVPGLGGRTLPIPPRPAEELGAAIARPLSIVQLLDRAGADGRPVISVNPSETLMVIQELPPWVLLAVKRDQKVEFGWTTLNQVAITR